MLDLYYSDIIDTGHIPILNTELKLIKLIFAS